MRLSRAIVLLVFTVAAVPTTLLLGVATYASKRAIVADVRDLASARTELFRLRLSERLEPTGKLPKESVEELLSMASFGAGTEVVVLDSAGRLVTSSEAANETALARRDPDAALLEKSARGRDPNPLAWPAIQGLLAERADLGKSGAVRLRELAGPDGAPQIATFAVVPGTAGWSVITLTPKAKALSMVRFVEWQGLLGLALGLVLAVVLGLLFARSIIGPIRAVVGQALDVSRGIFGREIKIRRRNELGDLVHTFNYMSKQLNAYDVENRGLYEAMEKGYLETIVALANSIDSKDSYTRGHSQRVADLSVATGTELKLNDRTLKHLFYGGILHDIGKIGIPEHILLKQGRLTDPEMEIMRQHPTIGATIIQPVAFLAPALPCVRNHHERWDGTGYPDRIKSTDIPLVARIVNVADTWDACTSTRPYQAAMSFDEAAAIMLKLTGTQCDPEVVNAMFKALEKWRAAGRPVTAAASQPPGLKVVHA